MGVQDGGGACAWGECLQGKPPHTVVEETRPRVATLWPEEPQPMGPPNTEACPSLPLPSRLGKQVWGKGSWPTSDSGQ